MLPVEGAQKVLQNLAAGHELIAITARLGTARQLTHPWLDRYFGGLFSSVHFSWNEYLTVQDGVFPRKGELCRDLGISVFIDDSVRTLEGCLSHGVRGILFGRIWNVSYAGSGMKRITAWEEVPGVLEGVGFR